MWNAPRSRRPHRPLDVCIASVCACLQNAPAPCRGLAVCQPAYALVPPACDPCGIPARAFTSSWLARSALVSTSPPPTAERFEVCEASHLTLHPQRSTAVGSAWQTMFTTPAPSAPTLSTTTSPASPTSPTRTGRLRGLSYLRSYTHLHSHSSDRSPAGSSGHIRRPSLVRTRSTPSANASLSSSSTDTTPSVDLPSHARHTPVDGPADAPGGTSGWVPTVVGRSGLSRVASSAEPSTTSATSPRPASMTRNRAESAAPVLGVTHHGPASGDATADGATPHKQLPSIRFIPHEDPRASRPSLQFPPISRTLPSDDCVIRVGRYSEKDNIPNDLPPNIPSSAPVGFKSKVVSRRHCEFWCKDGQWWIKDVKSSSGTFLNHIRLSQPGVESKPYKVGDGDVVQLGIDFRGGEEMIFRCVKIRIECNRNWQKALNNFK